MKYGKMQEKPGEKRVTHVTNYTASFHKTIICTDRNWGRILISEKYSGIFL
jgi:hypothetical protein